MLDIIIIYRYIIGMKFKTKVRRKCGRKFFTDEKDIIRSICKVRIKNMKERNKERFGYRYVNFGVDYLVRLFNLQKGRCVYTGTKLFIATVRFIEVNNLQNRDYLLSVDRIDPSKPYQRGNIQFVSNIFNKMKTNNNNAMLFRRMSEALNRQYRYYGTLSAIKALK